MEAKLNQYVIFKIGRETYAMDTSYVLRIEDNKKVRKIPNVNKAVKGLITVEEYIVPLVDLRIMFEIESNSLEEVPCIIVCKLEEEEDILAAFVVDEVLEVIELPDKVEFSHVNELIVGKASDYIQGIYRPNAEKDAILETDEELLIILDVEKLINVKKKTDSPNLPN